MSSVGLLPLFVNWRLSVRPTHSLLQARQAYCYSRQCPPAAARSGDAFTRSVQSSRKSGWRCERYANARCCFGPCWPCRHTGLRRAAGCVFVAEFADRHARERLLTPARVYGHTSCTHVSQVQHSDERPDSTSDIFLAERRRAMENERQQLWCPRLPRHC